MELVDSGGTLELHGDFDARSTWAVRAALRTHLDAPEHEIIVDLTDVDVIDLTALRVLAFASRSAGRTGHHVTLRGCGPSVRRMLHRSRLIRFVEVERVAATA